MYWEIFDKAIEWMTKLNGQNRWFNVFCMVEWIKFMLVDKVEKKR